MPKHSVRRTYHRIPALKSAIAGVVLILFAGLSVAFVSDSKRQEPQEAKQLQAHQAIPDVNDDQVPEPAEPADTAAAKKAAAEKAAAEKAAAEKAAADKAAAEKAAAAKAAGEKKAPEAKKQAAPKKPAPAAAPAPEPPAPPPPPPAPAGIDVYRGLGAWVDIYDYAIRDEMDIPKAIDVMAERGVKTLYLQTSRWKDPAAIVKVDAVNKFLDNANKKGINVVGWYVPGFGNIDRDVSRTLAILEHKTPSGVGFDGAAPDIETREEVGGNAAAYNAGVAEYSKRLRAAAPNATFAAIVDDAKNNLRAPDRHAGFPWHEIGHSYDVVMPMAYWTVTKGTSNCRAKEYDADAYIREVVRLTKEYMGVDKPMHPVGGIADCMTEAETHGYVRAINDVAIGGSLYDYATTQSSPVSIWGPLSAIK